MVLLLLPEKGLDIGLEQVPQDEDADGKPEDRTDASGDQGKEVEGNIDDDNDDPDRPYPAPALETPDAYQEIDDPDDEEDDPQSGTKDPEPDGSQHRSAKQPGHDPEKPAEDPEDRKNGDAQWSFCHDGGLD